MKSKNLIKLIKDKLDRKLISEFAALKPKACSYSMDDGNENKKAKGIKKCIIKQTLKTINIV